MELPEAPHVFAGAVGGPLIQFGVTPFRNALTVAATDQKSTALQVYRHVFRGGLATGWVGGIYTMIPAAPQYCVIGPAFHVWKGVLGGSAQAAVLGTGITESVISYGAETRNAQMAAGVKTNLQHPFKPWGSGLPIHVARNTVAMSGLRVLSAPIQRALDTSLNTLGVKISVGTKTVASDLIANLAASSLSMPLHQLYCFTVINSTPVSAAEHLTQAKSFLRKQFLVEGTNRLSKLAIRDVVLRCNYNATIFTIYGIVERTCEQIWAKNGW